LTQFVAFTGKRGCGKDTAAKALADLGFVSMSFADPLREILTIVYGLTDEEMNDRVLKEKTLERFPWISPRKLMTTIGTQGFRDLIHQETWVKALERRALAHEKVVVPDLRFLTEEAMLKENNAIIIRVVSPSREMTDAHAQHRSETEMDQIVPTFTVVNEGTIESLHANVRSILKWAPHLEDACRLRDARMKENDGEDVHFISFSEAALKHMIPNNSGGHFDVLIKEGLELLANPRAYKLDESKFPTFKLSAQRGAEWVEE